jgi:hypothetical protein
MILPAAVIALLACTSGQYTEGSPDTAAPELQCSNWRVEVLNQKEVRIYVYHVWAREDRLGFVEPRQLGQFRVSSTTRPDIRIKLGHSWYPWAPLEDVGIGIVCDV